MTCIIVANTNTCRIYHYEHHPEKFTLLKELAHPENKLKEHDLSSDKQGHYQSGDSARGSYSPHTMPKDIEIENFSREIAKELNQERNTHEYKQLILISAPRMNGLLQEHLNKHVKEMIINNVQKDLINLSTHDLLAYLKTHNIVEGSI